MLRILDAGLSMKQKLSLSQILLHFILRKWDFICAVTHYPVAVGLVGFRDVPQTLQIVILHFFPTSDALTWRNGNLCCTPLSFLPYDTFGIYIFSVIPPCGAARDNDHVVKWAAVPVPTSHLGAGAQRHGGLPIGAAERLPGSMTVIKYVRGCFGGQKKKKGKSEKVEIVWGKLGRVILRWVW